MEDNKNNTFKSILSVVEVNEATSALDDLTKRLITRNRAIKEGTDFRAQLDVLMLTNKSDIDTSPLNWREKQITDEFVHPKHGLPLMAVVIMHALVLKRLVFAINTQRVQAMANADSRHLASKKISASSYKNMYGALRDRSDIFTILNYKNGPRELNRKESYILEFVDPLYVEYIKMHADPLEIERHRAIANKYVEGQMKIKPPSELRKLGVKFDFEKE